MGKTSDSSPTTDHEHDVISARALEREVQMESEKKFLGQTKSTWYIYWICTVASIANMFTGFDGGIYSIIVSDQKFITKFNAVGPRAGAIASLVTVGNLLGNWFVSWWLIWYLGRRYTFIVGALIIMVGVGMQAGANEIGLLLIGRVIAGIGSVVTGTNLAAYQAEVSTPNIRGRVVATVQLSYQVGVLISYCVGLGTVHISGDNSWRTATALQLVPGFILIVVSLGIPESPRWQIERRPDRPEIALRTLSRIRCLPESHPKVQTEFRDLVAAQKYQAEYEGQFTWRKFLSSYGIWKRLAYGMGTMALGQISGVGALMLYGVLIFRGLGFDGTTQSLLLNVVSGVLQLLATAASMSFIDKWGRRPTLILGCATMVASYTLLAALSDAYPTETNFNRIAAGWEVACIFVIQMAYAGALGSCAWIYACEIFPTNVRDKGVNLSQSGQMLTILWINQAWPSMFDTVGHDAYWILFGINLVGLGVVVFFWPETKGISLEHMGKVFGELDKVDAWLSEKRGEPLSEEA